MSASLLAPGSIFHENLSEDSLCLEHFSILVGPLPGPAVTPVPPPFLAEKGKAAPLRLSIPTQPASLGASATQLPASSSSAQPRANRKSSLSSASPKSGSSSVATGWGLLKKLGGPSSSNAAVQGTTLSLGLGVPSTFGKQDDASIRPAGSPSPRPSLQSRSSTWADNIPTTRVLSSNVKGSIDPSSRHSSVPTQSTRPTSLVPSESAVPFPSGQTAAASSSTLVVPTARESRGKFGLFRRTSLSPRVEKAGFFFGLGGDERKGRIRGNSVSKEDKRKSMSAQYSPSNTLAAAAAWGDAVLEPPAPSFFSSSPATNFRRPPSPLVTAQPIFSTSVPSPQSPVRFSMDSSRSSGGRRDGYDPSTSSTRRSSHGLYPLNASTSSFDRDDEESDDEFPIRKGRAVKASKRKPRTARVRSQSPLRPEGESEPAGGAAGGKTKSWWKTGSSSSFDGRTRVRSLLGVSPKSFATVPMARSSSADLAALGGIGRNEPRVQQIGFNVSPAHRPHASLERIEHNSGDEDEDEDEPLAPPPPHRHSRPQSPVNSFLSPTPKPLSRTNSLLTASRPVISRASSSSSSASLARPRLPPRRSSTRSPIPPPQHDWTPPSRAAPKPPTSRPQHLSLSVPPSAPVPVRRASAPPSASSCTSATATTLDDEHLSSRSSHSPEDLLLDDGGETSQLETENDTDALPSPGARRVMSGPDMVKGRAAHDGHDESGVLSSWGSAAGRSAARDWRGDGQSRGLQIRA